MKSRRIIPAIGKEVRKLACGLYPLARFERKYVKKYKYPPTPPIFIVGAARSGSTLLYQLMTHYFKCSYFSNFASVFIKFPVLISKISRPFVKKYKGSTFQSDYGLTRGLWAPSEAGGIFNYWFDGQRNVDQDLIRNSVYKLSSIAGGPFICKNLVNSIRLKEICDVFPDAFIIHIKRDVVYNAQSIVLGLRNKKIEMRAVASEKELIGGDDIVVAVNYLLDVESSIEAAVQQQNHKHFIQINYSELCDNYLNELNKIRRFHERMGYKLEYKNCDKVSVVKSEKKWLGENDWVVLIDQCKAVVKS